MNRRCYLKASLAAGGSLLAPAGVLALVGCTGTSNTEDLIGIEGKIMGTSYSVRLGLNSDSVKGLDTSTEPLARQIHAVLQDVDVHMSTWRDDSELTLLNDSVDSDWQSVTPATAQVVAQALATSKASSGAFDVTVGPLVDLWGFGANAVNSISMSAGKAPARQAIRQSLAMVGYQAIEVDLDANSVRKLKPEVRLDLSGIAKGHAVDRVASLLDTQGYGSYLVEVGGELRSRGRKPDGSQWRVAIERPTTGRRDVLRIVNLDDRAIATSGDYRNFFADSGQRYSHSIDPRTGVPVSHALASVSVIAESTMIADALSTTLMILGPDDAMEFAQRHRIAAQLILKSGNSLEEQLSYAFEALLT